MLNLEVQSKSVPSGVDIMRIHTLRVKMHNAAKSVIRTQTLIAQHETRRASVYTSISHSHPSSFRGLFTPYFRVE